MAQIILITVLHECHVNKSFILRRSYRRFKVWKYRCSSRKLHRWYHGRVLTSTLFQRFLQRAPSVHVSGDRLFPTNTEHNRSGTQLSYWKFNVILITAQTTSRASSVLIQFNWTWNSSWNNIGNYIITVSTPSQHHASIHPISTHASVPSYLATNCHHQNIFRLTLLRLDFSTSSLSLKSSIQKKRMLPLTEVEKEWDVIADRKGSKNETGKEKASVKLFGGGKEGF